MRFRVWAPSAAQVELVANDRRYGLTRVDKGYWETDAPLADGDDYRYSLDGGDPLPDPRSHHQPEGVDGPSRVVDHAAFEWTDHDWCPEPLETWTIYELHIGTFTPEGTFDAAIGKLDHLIELGIEAVELLPVNTFSGNRGWGYDGVDLWAPHNAYGGPEGLKRFVDACHSKGLACILDVVYNHLGPAGNYLPRFGPYFTDVYATPWGDALNFDDSGSDEVRSFFIDNALYWFTYYHFDALRLDAVHAILDGSATHFLEELSERTEQAVERLGRPLYLIAESDLNDPRVITARGVGGLGMDAQWSDDFHHALHALLTGENNGYYEDFGSMEQLAKALRQSFVYDGIYSAHRDRKHGRPPTTLPPHRFLAYIQDHDQIGNRARGDRISHLVSPSLCKVAAGLVLTSPFIPMLFMGEEWGASTPWQYFTDHQDPKLGRAVSEGRRNEFSSFGWDPREVPDPQDPETFNRSKLDWSELDEPVHKELLDWHKELLALRKTEPILRTPIAAKDVAFDEEQRWLEIARDHLTIFVNVDDSHLEVEASGSVVLTSGVPPEFHGDMLRLEPESFTIVGR